MLSASSQMVYVVFCDNVSADTAECEAIKHACLSVRLAIDPGATYVRWNIHFPERLRLPIGRS